MFGDYVYNASGAPFNQSMLLIDHGLERQSDYADFRRWGLTC